MCDVACVTQERPEDCIHTAEDYTIADIDGSQAALTADAIAVPSWVPEGPEPGHALLRLLSQAHARGATIVGLCLGALVVSAAGLLDGRQAVTHWHAVDELAARNPRVKVDGSALYIAHGFVLTSAGTASGWTPVSISSASASAPRLPTRSPDRSWWHLIARADSLSTSSGRSRRMLLRTRSRRPATGRSSTSTRISASRTGLRGAHEPTLVREKLPSLDRLGASHLGPPTAPRRVTPAGA